MMAGSGRSVVGRVYVPVEGGLAAGLLLLRASGRGRQGEQHKT